VHVVGAGLAGSEAAWQVAQSGIPVILHEMRPGRMTEAHRTDGLAELVCAIRFVPTTPPIMRSDWGGLHAEMRRLGSAVNGAPRPIGFPPGARLAVDRADGFSAAAQGAA